jgi:hypothetical protein
MAMTSRVDLRLTATLTNALDLVTVDSPLVYTSQTDLISGTGAGAADMQWSDTRTLAASGTEDLDLSGSLTGPFGTTLAFARIKGLLIKAAAANTNNVQLIRPSSTGVPLFLAAGDGISIKPGGLFLWVAPDATGIAVTNSTGDSITLTNSGGTTGVTYDIVVIGASA